MDEDRIVIAVVTMLLLAHIGAFAWAWRTKKIGAVLGINLLISGAFTLYWMVLIQALFGSAMFFQLFVLFEVVVFLTSALAAFRLPVPRGIIWAEFAANLLLTGGVLFLLLTFKMTRLF
jgi:hypothetical protein